MLCCIQDILTTPQERLPDQLSLTKFTSPSKALTDPLNTGKPGNYVCHWYRIVLPCDDAVQFLPHWEEHSLFFEQQ